MNALLDDYSIDVFGAIKSSTGPGSTEFRFAGQQDDPALGYQYLRARYYDPATGRFISKDPFPGVFGNPQSQNPYPYVQNSPTNLTDPTGEIAFLAALAVGVVGGAVLGAGFSAINQYIDTGTIVGARVTRGAIGALAGGASVLVNPLVGGLIAGSFAELEDQWSKEGNFDNLNHSRLISSTVLGGALGVLPLGASNPGRLLNRSAQIGRELGQTVADCISSTLGFLGHTVVDVIHDSANE